MSAEAAHALALSKNYVVAAITRAAKKGKFSVQIRGLDEEDIASLEILGYNVDNLEPSRPHPNGIVLRPGPRTLFCVSWDT